MTEFSKYFNVITSASYKINDTHRSYIEESFVNCNETHFKENGNLKPS